MIRMGRAPCCDKANVKKGPWSPEEDEKLKSYIQNNHGTGGNWITLPHKIGLKRCGKSCRLRWLNYLRPNIKHGGFSDEEDSIICSLYIAIGSRWSIIAAQLPGRTDNDIKNHWNTKLKTMLLGKNQKNNRPRPSCNNIYHHLKSRAALMINYNADHMRQAAANAGAAAPAELLDLSATPAAAAAAAHEAAATDYYSVLQQLPEYCSGGDHQMRQDSSLKLAAAAAAADHNHALIRFPFYGAGSGGGAGDQAQLVAPSFTIPQQLQAAAMHHHHHEPAADPAMAAFSCMMHESASVLFNDASPPTWPNHACPAAADRDEEGYYGSTMKASGMNYFDLWNELLRSMMNSC